METPRTSNRGVNVYKKNIPKPTKRDTDIYVTCNSNFKDLKKHCEQIFNSGGKEIYLHCVGKAIIRGINLALFLVNSSNNSLSYAINTSTIQFIDELHPLSDEFDISFNQRNNSAIHIKISSASEFALN